MLSGVVAHPLVWICCWLLLSLLGVINLTLHLIANLPLVLPFDFPLVLLDLPLVLPFSVLSLILAGWITAAVGGIAGGLLVHLQAVLVRRMRQQDGIVSLPNG
jgi:hypothetical protein